MTKPKKPKQPHFLVNHRTMRIVKLKPRESIDLGRGHKITNGNCTAYFRIEYWGVTSALELAGPYPRSCGCRGCGASVMSISPGIGALCCLCSLYGCDIDGGRECVYEAARVEAIKTAEMDAKVYEHMGLRKHV